MSGGQSVNLSCAGRDFDIVIVRGEGGEKAQEGAIMTSERLVGVRGGVWPTALVTGRE